VPRGQNFEIRRRVVVDSRIARITVNGQPLSARIRLLSSVLGEVVIMIHDRGPALDLTVAQLLVEVQAVVPDTRRIEAAWHRALVALADLDDGCDGGPLLALLYDQMLSPDRQFPEPVDSCLALGLWQALRLLPDDTELADAAAVLVTEYEKFPPDVDKILLALRVACRVLDRMIHDGTGGAVALLLLEWLRSRGG
jgi:hypothetical protein